MVLRCDKQKIDTQQSVELGEGVEIILRIAGPFPRALALILDYLIISGVLIVLSILLSVIVNADNYRVLLGGMLICLFLLGWGYFAFFEGGKRGATPGKRAMGLRVVDSSGNGASRGQAFVRNVLRFFDMLPGVPSGAMGIMIGGYGAGLLSCLLSKKFQRMGDLVANTVVIYSNPVRHLHTTVAPVSDALAPPIVLTREEQAAITAFQQRAGMWSEARRVELAGHANELTGRADKEGLQRLLGMAHWLTEGK